MIARRFLRSLASRLFLVNEQIANLSPTRYMRWRQVERARQTNQTFSAHIPLIGCKMLIDPTRFFAQAYVRGSYEPHVVKYLKSNLRPGTVCLDVGANVGYFSLLMARRVGPTGRVIAFEPTEYTFDMLQKNVRLNNLGNVDVELLALSDRTGPQDFHVGPPGFDVYNSGGKITHPSAVQEVFGTVSVSCTTLDEYAGAHGVDRIDLIKIDVEGAELFALMGMEETLNANPRAKLVVEFADQTTRGFGYSAEDIVSWLTQRGWQLFVLGPRGDLRSIPTQHKWTGQMVLACKDCAVSKS